MIISFHIDFGSSASTASEDQAAHHNPLDAAESVVAGGFAGVEDAFEVAAAASVAFASVVAFAVAEVTFADPDSTGSAVPDAVASAVASAVAFDAAGAFVATEDSFAVDSVEAQTFQRIAVVG